jgi:hypothetical protein
MSFIGIGYKGENAYFLRNKVQKYFSWLQGDRKPHFFGDGFLVLYDSNTAREFAKKCFEEANAGEITIYQMGDPLDLKCF